MFLGGFLQSMGMWASKLTGKSPSLVEVALYNCLGGPIGEESGNDLSDSSPLC